jgi:hypothetical protein
MGPTACLPKARCLRLEQYALKGACTVLRGGGEGNLTSLPDLERLLRALGHPQFLLRFEERLLCAGLLTPHECQTEGDRRHWQRPVSFLRSVL